VEWLGPALVFYVAVAATLTARRRLTQLARLRVTDVQGLVRAIRSGRDDDLVAFRSRAPADSFEGLVVSAVLEDTQPAARVASVNEHLGDLDREIESQRDIPRVVGRGALLSGTLACVLELTLSLNAPSGPAWGPAASAFLLGLAGFLSSARIDRGARDVAALTRAEWDKVAAVLGERFGQGSADAKPRI
jgi:hypothetical protein